MVEIIMVDKDGYEFIYATHWENSSEAERWIKIIDDMTALIEEGDDDTIPCMRYRIVYDQTEGPPLKVKPTSAPKPYGDGVHFKNQPGDYMVIEGPGGVGITYAYASPEEIWEALRKAYAYGFEMATPRTLSDDQIEAIALKKYPKDDVAFRFGVDVKYTTRMQYEKREAFTAGLRHKQTR